jgi:hypothetical protein
MVRPTCLKTETYMRGGENAPTTIQHPIVSKRSCEIALEKGGQE